MTPDQLFPLVNLIALCAWVLLALVPRRHWVIDIIAGLTVPALFATVYIALIAANWSSSPGGFSTLASVAELFANPWLLLAGWVHYLCFDLLVGCWEVRDAHGRGVPHMLVIPCLVLTFMFGPAGWLLYRGIGSAYPRPPGGQR